MLSRQQTLFFLVQSTKAGHNGAGSEIAQRILDLLYAVLQRHVVESSDVVRRKIERLEQIIGSSFGAGRHRDEREFLKTGAGVLFMIPLLAFGLGVTRRRRV